MSAVVLAPERSGQAHDSVCLSCGQSILETASIDLPAPDFRSFAVVFYSPGGKLARNCLRITLQIQGFNCTCNTHFLSIRPHLP